MTKLNSKNNVFEIDIPSYFVKIKTDTGYKDDKAVLLIFDQKYKLRLIDQRVLPHKLEYVSTDSVDEAIHFISDMAVRGAPAIGTTGAYSVVLGVQEKGWDKIDLDQLASKIIDARPTAKDLETFVMNIINWVKDHPNSTINEIASQAKELAKQSEDECKQIGLKSKSLIRDGMGVLTHCNAGALATVDWGTALSTIRLAHYDGKKFKVFVDETRPRMQGMLTAWELENEGIDYEVIVDNAAGLKMYQDEIQLVITGCDRVIKDGTVTNKIGTFEKAVVANSLDIPFYVAMPWTTYDPDIDNADEIPIEYREEIEITHINTKEGKKRISSANTKTSNPAFDITPSKYITGYITKDGILSKHELQEVYTRQNYGSDNNG